MVIQGAYVFLSCDSSISKHDFWGNWVRERESWRSFHYLSLEMIHVTFVHWPEIVLWLCPACNTSSKCGSMNACSVGNLCCGRSGLQLIHLLLVYLLGKVLKRMKISHLYSCTFYSRNWCRTRREGEKRWKKEKQRFTLWLGFNLLGRQFEIYICISFWRS